MHNRVFWVRRRTDLSTRQHLQPNQRWVPIPGLFTLSLLRLPLENSSGNPPCIAIWDLYTPTEEHTLNLSDYPHWLFFWYEFTATRLTGFTVLSLRKDTFATVFLITIFKRKKCLEKRLETLSGRLASLIRVQLNHFPRITLIMSEHFKRLRTDNKSNLVLGLCV